MEHNKINNFVALLGTKGGPAIRPGSTNPTSSLLCLNGKKIIIDCGLGVARGLADQGVQPQEIETIFITHMHSDHYLELGPLLLTAWTAGLKTPVTIYGPRGIEKYWQSFLLSMKSDIDLRIQNEGRVDFSDLVSIHTLEVGEIELEDSIKAAAIKNLHPPLLDSFALSFSNQTHKVTFSGDTSYFEPLINFAIGSDLLIHEAMLEEGVDALVARIGHEDDRLKAHLMRAHTLAGDAAKVASQAKVKALALHHLVPSDDPNFTEAHWLNAVKPHWDGPFYLGKDGMRIDLV